ncbi:hypothetical protein KM043_001332 [Ampulex compressa]|nr:hypothetical protein KM043_001332 [Ampulex compressa]
MDDTNFHPSFAADSVRSLSYSKEDIVRSQHDSLSRKGHRKTNMENQLLSPGQRIRPSVTEEEAVALLKKLYGMKATSIIELNAYDDKNYHVFCEESHENPHVTKLSQHGYVLKILNSLTSRNTGVIEAQNEMMLFLSKRDIVCPVPVKSLSGSFYSLENLSGENSGDRFVVRLLVYRPGEILHRVPKNSTLLRNVGHFGAKLDEILSGFSHPAFEDYKTLWMLSSVPVLRQFLYAVKGEAERKLTEDVIVAFEKDVLQVEARLEQGVIHGDLNEQNILMDKGSTEIAAIIDFGDSQKTCLVFELAVALCYMIMQAGNVTMGKYVIEGYQSVRKLSELERNILKVCACARMCQSLVLGAYSHLHDPRNEYLLVTQKSGWALLKKLWPMSHENVLQEWGLTD